MDDLLKQDIFFFVSSVGMVVLVILFAILLVYLIIVFRTVKRISEKVKAEVDEAANDIQNLRTNLKEQGHKLKYVFDYFKPKPKRTKKEQ